MSKEHWENIFTTKEDNQVSWTQEYPSMVIDYLSNLSMPKDSSIIDIGGGASRLPDLLLKEGYTNITVLDISAAALKRSQDRLGVLSNKVNWIVSNILDFDASSQYDFWYDRAVFHFFTDITDIKSYVHLASSALNSNGNLLIGTFSNDGPLKCSGLEVSRYSEDELTKRFSSDFYVHQCFKEQHKTPFDTIQEFQFCGFRKKS